MWDELMPIGIDPEPMTDGVSGYMNIKSLSSRMQVRVAIRKPHLPSFG